MTSVYVDSFIRKDIEGKRVFVRLLNSRLKNNGATIEDINCIESLYDSFWLLNEQEKILVLLLEPNDVNHHELFIWKNRLNEEFDLDDEISENEYCELGEVFGAANDNGEFSLKIDSSVAQKSSWKRPLSNEEVIGHLRSHDYYKVRLGFDYINELDENLHFQMCLELMKSDDGDISRLAEEKFPLFESQNYEPVIAALLNDYTGEVQAEKLNTMRWRFSDGFQNNSALLMLYRLVLAKGNDHSVLMVLKDFTREGYYQKLTDVREYRRMLASQFHAELHELQNSKNLAVLREATLALRCCDDSETLSKLVQITLDKSNDKIRRRRAMKAMASLSLNPPEETIRQLSLDRDPEIAKFTVYLLRGTSNEFQIEILSRLFNKKDKAILRSCESSVEYFYVENDPETVAIVNNIKDKFEKA